MRTDALEKQKPTIGTLIQKAASKLVAEEDVWAKHNIPSIPAERVIRHLYNPVTESWESDETIVKIQSEPFTHGAMRYCFRMKKMASLPKSASNHRFHKAGWTRASNYVAKAYMTTSAGENSGRGSHDEMEILIDCSNEAKKAVQNDIILQYEAMHWATKFNNLRPPRTIVFLRAYAIEFPNRPGRPWMAVERFIAGNDDYGAGFTKHNTNSGFVDKEERRKTPQVFSAYSFYASNGSRLVADIQGVGDLYTDPQVLSSDYRFGDGDLGHRGMALFFHSFRHSSYSDLMGIPIFPLSRNELKHQAKYNEDDLTMSDDERTEEADADAEEDRLEKDRRNLLRLDLNRMRRKSLLKGPSDFIHILHADGKEGAGADDLAVISATTETMPTMRRSNMSHLEIRSSVRQSMAAGDKRHRMFTRTKSEVDEITRCMELSVRDAIFDHKTFHRKASGELRERTAEAHKDSYRKDVKPAPPMIPNDETKANLGKVHYHLACLHGLNRFPEMEEDTDDLSSVVFHLAHASSLRCVAACLALGRVRAGLNSQVSPHLNTIVPIDFDSAKELLQRALETTHEGPNTPASAKTRAAAGCILLQILHEEEGTTDVTLQSFLEETLRLIDSADRAAEELQKHKERMERGGQLHVGDRVEGNYFLEGTYYPGVVIAVEDGGDKLTVQYDDDGSSETLPVNAVRPLLPPRTTQKRADLGLTEAEALGLENSDEDCLVETYTLQSELADIKVRLGLNAEATSLYEQAADGAMNAGKMKTAAECSQKAAELAG